MENLGAQDPRWIGEYRLLARLGEGGMGRVYLARSARGRTVAVKLVKAELARQPDFRSRFQREVAAARRVGGQWTAPVLDADTEAEVPWVATGYIGGPSLHDVVAGQSGALPEHSVRTLAHGLALALRDIHGAGLIHRDLKPSNILVTIDGPRVIDFGIARALETIAGLGSGLTVTGAVVGSPGFMSPEQVRGETVTTASDVFCLGSVLAFAATGRQPFGNVTSGVHALLYRIAQEEPDLEGLPEGLRELVTGCLHKDPAARLSVEDVVARTAPQAERAGAAAGPWLPGELLAKLGRDALQLLEMEADAETDSDTATLRRTPVPAGPDGTPVGVAAPGHATPGGPAVPGAYAQPTAPAAYPAAAHPGYPMAGGGAGQPWAAAQHHVPGRFPAPPARTLRPSRGLGNTMMWLFGAFALLSVAHLGLNGTLYSAYVDKLGGTGGQSAIDETSDALGILEIFTGLLGLSLVVMYPVWFRRAYLNATFLAPGRQRYDSGLAVGSWFIPVAQLWLPKQMANDIWSSSAPPGTRPASRALLHWWWALYVTMFVVIAVQGLVDAFADTTDENRQAVAWDILNDLVSIPAAVLALLVVSRVTRMQQPQRWQPEAGAFGPPAMR
ncbi:protein kinase domain-containing protein [Streptomyces cuspidosporus]|uniref:Protein kinase domain-containing protein n=1 Tax=Streptomyces cuspidosporus TaxID=66882 RepID=A0ABP5SVN6_9ACTN